MRRRPSSSLLKLTTLCHLATQCTTYRSNPPPSTPSMAQTSRPASRLNSWMLSRPPTGSPVGSLETRDGSPSSQLTRWDSTAWTRGALHGRARRMRRTPRSEREKRPAAEEAGSGCGRTMGGSSTLRGRYGGRGMGKVLKGEGTGVAKSLAVGNVTWGL